MEPWSCAMICAKRARKKLGIAIAGGHHQSWPDHMHVLARQQQPATHSWLQASLHLRSMCDTVRCGLCQSGPPLKAHPTNRSFAELVRSHVGGNANEHMLGSACRRALAGVRRGSHTALQVGPQAPAVPAFSTRRHFCYVAGAEHQAQRARDQRQVALAWRMQNARLAWDGGATTDWAGAPPAARPGITDCGEGAGRARMAQ